MGDRIVERKKGVVLLLVAALLWSTSGLLIKLVEWNPMAISGMRSGISAIVLTLFHRRLRFPRSLAQIGGVVGYAGTVTLFVTATKLTTAANAILLQYTAPIYVALLSAWLLRERVSRLDWVTIFLVMTGMTLFFVDRLTLQDFLGNLLAVLSGITLACFTVAMRKQRHESPLETVILGNIFAALLGFPFMFGSLPDASSWLGLFLLGAFQLSIPYILFSHAIRYVTALDAILFPVVETMLNPLWVLLIIGETPGTWALLGGFIVLSSITARGLTVTRAQRMMEVESHG